MNRAIVILLAFAGLAAAEERPHLQDVPRQIEKGRMERRDEESKGRFDLEIDALEPAGLTETTAKVRIRNLSDFALEDVELTCTAFDERENELATTSWRLQEAGGGAMQAGELTTVTLKFEAAANKVRSASCNARGW